MRLRLMLVCCAAFALSVGVATATGASQTIVIDGHFTETYPQGTGGTGSPSPHLCFNGDSGSGMLKGFGTACEQFAFESFEGFDANGCALFTGTVTFTLADAQHSSFAEREHDVQCHPPNWPQEEGENISYGHPFGITGTWNFLPGTGTGVFAGVCAGSGDVRFHTAGAAINGFYTGVLALC
jgi:hypothetical protein